jgi:hypothetical protein
VRSQPFRTGRPTVRAEAVAQQSVRYRPLVDALSVGSGRDDPIDPAIWRREDMRAAMVDRDIGAMFKILGRHGISQRRIAALTGQSQSEISEIIAGRQVSAYDVLARIAYGFSMAGAALGPGRAAAVRGRPRATSSDVPGRVPAGRDRIGCSDPRRLCRRRRDGQG